MIKTNLIFEKYSTVPSKERNTSKASIESSVGVGRSLGIDLSTSTKTVDGIEETGAHETHEAEHDYLGVWGVVQTLEAGGPLIDLGRGIGVGIGARVGLLLVLGHDRECVDGRWSSGVRRG
jgi:hypothetical protein